MRYFIFILLLCSVLQAQTTVIDSTVWVYGWVDKENMGDKECKHKYMFDTLYPTVEEGNQFLRKAVCSICGRVEIQQQVVYSHVIEPVKTEFDAGLDKAKSSAVKDKKEIFIDALKAMEVTGAVEKVDGAKVEAATAASAAPEGAVK